MEGRDKLRNLDNFAVVSLGILRAGPWYLAKFTALFILYLPIEKWPG